jgi:hypothetical protein
LRMWRDSIIVSFLVSTCTAALLTCASTSRDEEEINMRKLVPEEIHGWKVQGEIETYDRETIFDYIDGAGEIYLMYDFRRVVVFHLTRASQPQITIEVFDMGSSGDAFGIFSHAREGEEEGIGQGSEYRGGVLCFWKGKFFVCVFSEGETPEAEKAVAELAARIAEKITITGARPELIDHLPDQGLVENSVRYFHKHTSLNYHYFVASENILKLGMHTQAVMARYEPASSYLLCVSYPDQEQAGEAFGSFVSSYIPEAAESGAALMDDGKWTAVKQQGPFVIVVFDAPTKAEAQNLIKIAQGRLPESISE